MRHALALLALVAALTDVARAAAPAGWSSGTPAAATAQALRRPDPVPVVLPDAIAHRIRRPTAIVWFSPTCPHCQRAMPDLRRARELAGDRLDWLGVATSRATPEQLEAFRRDHGVFFEVVVDRDGAFARATGLTGTPSVLVVRPDGPGLLAVDRYAPWFPGASALFVARLDPAHPFAAFTPGTYLGPDACAACHALEAASTALQRHAYALRTLYLRDRAGDPTCLGCHVTGLGRGGFEPGDLASPLGGVTCEACHGPGGPHDGRADDPRTACPACHDPDHSVAFSLARALPHVDHYLAAHLRPREIRERLEALADGSAPRPLVAFPEGPNPDPATCRSCHPAAWERWAQGPHRAAVGRLGPGEREDPACLGCHATPRRAGAAPAGPEGFALATGVACGSCHGPAGEHLDNPRADNVVGLGTTCPECVVEAICTTCHTAGQDPDFDLARDLPRAGHRPP